MSKILELTQAVAKAQQALTEFLRSAEASAAVVDSVPRSVERTVPGDAAYLLADVLSTVEKIAPSGVPKSYLRKMLFLENFTSDQEIGTTVTGYYRGLGQFSRRTWNDIRREFKLEHDLPSWELGTQDPVVSLLMAGYLYLSNAAVFGRQFPGQIFTDEIAYLYHQQGATAAKRFLLKGNLVYPNQSKKSLVVLDKARASLTGEATVEPVYPSWVA